MHLGPSPTTQGGCVMRINHLAFVLLFFIIGLLFPAVAAAQYYWEPPQQRGCSQRYSDGRCVPQQRRYSYGDQQCVRAPCNTGRARYACDSRSNRYQPGCYNRPPVMQRPRYHEPQYGSYQPRPMYRPRPSYRTPRYGPPPRYSHRHNRGCGHRYDSRVRLWISL